ncbi:ribonuclease Oy-like [Coccinella septempunctata]|uniref:ribonuclease Oy-like n=1 Tax=Coccinella septempunctata TaxID=41139 RepID=UPI001D081880|nr:ribonuclease Oy-like [Coccinella septempunctata]
MYLIRILNILHLLLFLEFSECVDNTVSKNSDFDYLLYSQRWPITDCLEWRDKNETNECNMPKQRNSFLVHGLWPTKNGTSGPNYCKSNITFDIRELDPLIDDLNEHWTNIENGTDSYDFWSHEWQKHGTCASILPQFGSVYDYFDISLDLNLLYDLSGVLSSMGIVPREESYEIDDFISALFYKFKSTTQINCIIDSADRALLSEIRICFDKSLQVIDCVPMGVNPKRMQRKDFYILLKR